MEVRSYRTWFKCFSLLIFSIVIAGCGGDPKVELDISDQAVTDNKMLEISGTVTDAEAGTIVVLSNATAVSSNLVEDGTFVLPPYLLDAGENLLNVEARLDGEVVASAEVTVVYESSVSATDDYTTEGTEPVVVAINDSTDPAYGASITIPAGSLDVDVDVSIESDSEHLPKLPLGTTAVGNPVTFQPIGQSFAEPVQLSVPYTPDQVTPEDSDRLVVYGLSDNGWERLVPELIGTNTLGLSLEDLFYGAFIAALDNEYPAGTVVLRTSPSGATVHLNGVKQPELSPQIIEGVDSGEHEFKLYILGYNEKFVSFSVADQALLLEESLTRVDETVAPQVNIDSSIPDEQSVNDNVFNITGSVSVASGNLTGTRLVLSHNDTDSYVSLAADGTYSHTISLQPGANTLHLRATDGNGNTGSSRTISVINTEGAGASAAAAQGYGVLSRAAVQAAAQNRSITAVLTWNKDDTDVDLHMYDPQGNHAWYQDLGGIPGAQLDIDDTDGFGPETFTYPTPISGEYQAQLVYYSDHGNGSTTANLVITVGSQQIFSGSRTLVDGETWNAHTFTIEDFSIASVSPNNGVFTTANGENQIIVTLNVPAGIDPATITFSVEEVNEAHVVSTPTGVDANGEQTITLTHEPLQSLTQPASRKLKYRITANAGGEQTDPVEIEQDVRSQIRQEYVDKRDFQPSFAVSTPSRGQIITAAGFPASVTNFGFDEFSRYSDYGPTYAVINRSVNIAQTLRTAWNFPLSVTSGWRNPRRNDGLSPTSSVNSLHQSGDAVDLNPSFNRANWPATASTYAQAQQQLTALARTTFNADYDILFHANHLHIEYDP